MPDSLIDTMTKTEAAQFRPTLYLLEGCPFSFKAFLFLSEAGTLAGFDIVEVASGSVEEAAVKDQLAAHFEKVSFPTVQFERGKFMNESDAIIDRYSDGNSPDIYPVFSFYARSVLPGIKSLWKENKELKARLSDHGTTS
jgi:spore cortex formation protein SpoVR/YcgB (stage V sporulation)